MSLALAARHLASQGRNRDTELVHMSRPEVAGLQALARQHGGNLTRNPTTGLVEAGFLDSILPTVAGAGLSMAFPELTPLMSAGIVGGGTALLSGGNLQKGLMAGLGAYGGAGIGQALMSSGAESLAGAAPVLEQGASVVPTPVAPSTASGFGGVGTDAAIMQNPTLPSQATGFGGVGTDAAVGRAGLALPPATTQNVAASNALGQAAAAPTPAALAVEQAAMRSPAEQYAQSAQEYASKYANAMQQTPGATMLQGVKNLGQTGGLSALATRMGGNMDALKYAGAAVAPALMDMTSSEIPSHTAATDYANTIRPYKFSQYHNPNAPINSQTPYFTQTMTPQTPYVAPYAGGGMAKGPARGESLRGTMGQLRGVEHLMSYANGGMSNLGSYSDGGQLLRGPGDGVSDDIPAQIGQQQPARLAEGEFVVPARIVSELGNGSTNAGAKRLYAMLNRIQAGRAQTMGGKNAYANDTNAERHLPA